MYYCNNERLSKRKGAARDEWRCFFYIVGSGAIGCLIQA